MIEMNKGEEEEESRRRFLFNALQLVCDDNKGQKPSGPSTTKLSTGSANANKHKPNDFREHGQGNWNYTKVTRIPQLDTWDCGIACLLMITLWLRDDREYDIQFDNNGKEIHHHGEDLDALSEADAEHCFRARMAPERKKMLIARRDGIDLDLRFDAAVAVLENEEKGNDRIQDRAVVVITFISGSCSRHSQHRVGGRLCLCFGLKADYGRRRIL